MPAMLILAACDRQQAVIERHETDPRRALLRLQLPARPDPRGYQRLVVGRGPAGPAAHRPGRRHTAPAHPAVAGGRVLADVAFTHPVPAGPPRTGHTVALGIDWGLNTLLSAPGRAA